MIGMMLKDGESPVDLLQQNHTGQFMSQGHSSERKNGERGLAGWVTEAVRRPHCQDQRLEIPVLVVLEELGEFLRRELLSAGVEKNDRVRGAGTALFAHFQKGGLVGQGQAFDFRVAGDSLEVFVGQGLDGGVFCFANPGDFEFHERDLNTEDTGDHRGLRDWWALEGSRKALGRGGRRDKQGSAYTVL